MIVIDSESTMDVDHKVSKDKGHVIDEDNAS
jgi:hypothetical protein